MNSSYYKAEADEVEAKNDSVLTPQYENEVDPSEQQFYNILQQQGPDDAEEKVPANDAEERKLMNDTEERILANLRSDLVPRWALPDTSITTGLRRGRRHKNARAVYQVLDGPMNILKGLQSAECDMSEGTIECKLEVWQPMSHSSTVLSFQYIDSQSQSG